uniref:Membrane protein n=1 Tax=Magnetospirillum gryphiswaldense TaxID=55518 RepID=A4U1R3_9PROT|nr:membrane protein [Magnetospirillum gryphiswaldense MSR-1]
MKARSVIFTHVQYPMTIFGLPPILTILSLAGGAVAYVVLVLAGAVPIALIGAAVVTVIGLVKTHRLGRTDRHIESAVLSTFKFWGFSSRRGLLTGAFPKQRSHTAGGRS